MAKSGKITRTLAAAILGTALGSAAANANDLAPVPPSTDWITHGQRTQPMHGHVDFCKRHPEDCSYQSPHATYMALNAANRRLLTDINTSVNHAVQPFTDQQIYNRDEYWAYPLNGKGDCEDIALEKRRMLIAHGWSPSALMIAVVKQSNGEGHAVLVARTRAGDYVLDNLSDQVVRWNELNYRYVKTTNPGHHGEWLSVVPAGGYQAVSSVPAPLAAPAPNFR